MGWLPGREDELGVQCLLFRARGGDLGAEVLTGIHEKEGNPIGHCHLGNHKSFALHMPLGVPHSESPFTDGFMPSLSPWFTRNSFKDGQRMKQRPHAGSTVGAIPLLWELYVVPYIFLMLHIPSIYWKHL